MVLDFETRNVYRWGMDVVTPNRARIWRAELRKATDAYAQAAASFLAAMSARRSATRALATVPSLHYGIGLALARGDIGATNRAWRERVGAAEQVAYSRALLAAEDALGPLCDARQWLRACRARVRDIDTGRVRVEAGAAWSARGLANVRNANSRR